MNPNHRNTNDSKTNNEGTTDTAVTTEGGAAEQSDGTTTPPNGSTGTEASNEWETFDAERARRTIENQRRSEAELKKRLAAAEATIAEHTRSQMSKEEQLQNDLEQARQAADEARKVAAEATLKASFDAHAISAGVNPQALRAAQVIASEVAESDESGMMRIDEELFSSLRTSHGYLFTQPEAPRTVLPNIGAAISQGHTADATKLTPEQVAMAQRAGITPDEFAKYLSH